MGHWIEIAMTKSATRGPQRSWPSPAWRPHDDPICSRSSASRPADIVRPQSQESLMSRSVIKKLILT
jgi:hypothetical protein